MPGFDLALSLFSLQAINDLPGAIIQIRRLLKPDGLFLGVLFGGATRQVIDAIQGGAMPGSFCRPGPLNDLFAQPPVADWSNRAPSLTNSVTAR